MPVNPARLAANRSQGTAVGAMPVSKEPRFSNFELLRAIGDPTYKAKPMTAH